MINKAFQALEESECKYRSRYEKHEGGNEDLHQVGLGSDGVPPSP